MYVKCNMEARLHNRVAVEKQYMSVCVCVCVCVCMPAVVI